MRFTARLRPAARLPSLRGIRPIKLHFGVVAVGVAKLFSLSNQGAAVAVRVISFWCSHPHLAPAHLLLSARVVLELLPQQVQGVTGAQVLLAPCFPHLAAVAEG